MTRLPPEPGSDELAARRLPRRDRPGRRPRRAPETLVLRLDVVDARPPIWRRVSVPSTLMLDQVHDLLQLLFGWTDSHLHRFALGASVWDRDAVLFLCPDDVEEGEDDGFPADEVRLDETLGDPGDVLRYVYDYGDEWTVALTLEKRVPEPCPHPRVVAGRHEAPVDDTGGIWAWNDEGRPEPLDLAALDRVVRRWGAAQAGPAAD